MKNNYSKIVKDNLERFFANVPSDACIRMSATHEKDGFMLKAFGCNCHIGPEGIYIDGVEETSIHGILLSLYALSTQPDCCIEEPFKSFKDFSGSAPYVGAFTTHAEQILIPYVDKIKKNVKKIIEKLGGREATSQLKGDISFVVYPLPKIALAYIFYLADEDFPASAKCLFSGNALKFLPIEGIADLGEYCSKTLIDLSD